MVVIVLAVALGAIFSIVVVLLFRRINVVARHTAEVGETVRQLTETDVELYRELLRLRRELTGGPSSGRETIPRAAVAGGHLSNPPSIPQQHPARSKRHLALYILSTAVVALTALIRESLRAYRGRVASALAGAVATASTVTLLTVTPWQGDMSQPPSSAPTAPPAIHAPQPGDTPPTATPPAGQSSLTQQPLPSAPGVSPAPDDPSLSDASWPRKLLPIGAVSSPTTVPSLPGGGITSSGVPDSTASTSAPSTPSSPSSSAPAGTGVCAGVSAAPVGGANLCLPAQGGG